MCHSLNSRKIHYNPYFGGLRSFKVIDVDIAKKLAASARYDKQHVCAYLQPFYVRKQLLFSARLSHRNSVCPSVTRVDQSKTVQARITKSLPLAAWKTLASGTVKLFHKFEGGHSERGC